MTALEPHGPTEPFQKLHTSNAVYALAVLGKHGLAAGTGSSTVELFNISALQAHGTTESYDRIAIHGVPNTMFVYEDVQKKPSWFAAHSVLQPIPCSASSFRLNEGNCVDCPHGLSSLAGSEMCTYPSWQLVLGAVISVGTFYLVVIAATLGLGSMAPLPAVCAYAQSWQRLLRACPWIIAIVILGFDSTNIDLFWARVGATLLLSRAALVLARVLSQAILLFGPALSAVPWRTLDWPTLGVQPSFCWS